MTQVLKMTSKRQVTFPRIVCNELGIDAGQEIVIEKRNIAGETAWLLKPKNKKNDHSWFASLREYADGKSHEMTSIRASIGKNLKI